MTSGATVSPDQVSLGARPLTVDLLTVVEARELLTRRLGPTRVAAESEATDEIITRCARLPLALGIVATRAATNPGFALAALAGELRDAGSTLDGLSPITLTPVDRQPV